MLWSCASQPPLPSHRNELKVICFFQAVTQAFQSAETKQTKPGPKQLFFVPSLICQVYCLGWRGKKTERITTASSPVIKNWWVASIHGSNIKLSTAADVTWFLSHKRPSRVTGGYCYLLNFACLKRCVCKSYLMTQTCFFSLKVGAMVTDMLAPAQHVTLSIISACFYIMVFD